MMIIESQIEFANEHLTLTNYKSIFWSKTSTLILSDLHLGKAAHFRKHGIAIPTQVSMADYENLKKLLCHFKPKKVVIVGDLIHAENNVEVSCLKDFIQAFSDIEFILIKGNHDKKKDLFFREIGIHQIHQSLTIEGISFTHEPQNKFTTAHICGHIHPGILIPTPSRQMIKLPCYVVTENQIILPAFSQFTGLDTKKQPSCSKIYAVHKDGVFEI